MACFDDVMASYDDFRAPQYVDFTDAAQLEGDSMDTSFFDSTITTVVDCDDSFSEVDKTITPNHTNNIYSSGKTSDPKDSLESLDRTPFPRTYISRGSCRTPLPSTSYSNIKINVIPATPMIQKGNRRRSLSESGVLEKMSEVDNILDDALKSLTLSSKKKRSPASLGYLPHSSDSGQSFQMTSESSATGENHRRQSKGEEHPKRKLSPISKNARDYSRPPEKYMSMAEHCKVTQKQVPPRFRTTPSSSLMKSRQPYLKKTVSFQPLQESLSSENVQEGENSLTSAIVKRGIRVPKWPAPKVEPFQLKDYRKREDIPTEGVKVFQGNSRIGQQTNRRKAVGKIVTVHSNDGKFGKMLLGNFGTPTSHRQVSTTMNVTKVQPFSFDERDKELLRKKIARRNGNVLNCQPVNDNDHAVQGRRRSKSVGNYETSSGERSTVHHARIPVVLHKPPFIPKKGIRPPTKPIDISLFSDKRAIERKKFDSEIKERDNQRQIMMKQFQEKREEEERKKEAILRRELVHKARPKPNFKPYQVKQSMTPLTEPHTPLCIKRRKPT